LIQIDRWLESPTLILLHEEEAYWDTLRPLIARSQVTGGAVHDARIAALCLRHGVTTLYSADRDFSRFPDLQTENPLIR
jgi:predicted nucleic acid-binding protein